MYIHVYLHIYLHIYIHAHIILYLNLPALPFFRPLCFELKFQPLKLISAPYIDFCPWWFPSVVKNIDSIKNLNNMSSWAFWNISPGDDASVSGRSSPKRTTECKLWFGLLYLTPTRTTSGLKARFSDPSRAPHPQIKVPCAWLSWTSKWQILF